jgi:hypothetical protein
MSSALRVVITLLDNADLEEPVKAALRNALMIEFNGSSLPEFEGIIDEYIERRAE